MRPSAPDTPAAATAIWLPTTFSTLNCLLLILATSTPSTSATRLPTLTTAVSPSPSPSFSTPILTASPINPSLPQPNTTPHTPPHAHLPSHNQTSSLHPVHEKAYQEAQWIVSGRQAPPNPNAKVAMRNAAQKPAIVAVYVVCGVLVLALTVAVVKALMYRRRHGGYWW